MNRTLRDTVYVAGIVIGGMLLAFGAVLGIAVWGIRL